MKLKTKPQADYFLAINTPSSVAVWPLELGEFNIENTEKLVQFSSEISGVTMDQTMALQLSTNVVNNLTLNDSDVREWHKWHKSGNSLNTPFTDREPEQYRQFLISQNTLSSLEEILYNYPMDKEVLKLYAKKLFEFSKDKSIESFKRDRYKTSAIWYESIAE